MESLAEFTITFFTRDNQDDTALSGKEFYPQITRLHGLKTKTSTKYSVFSDSPDNSHGEKKSQG
jgi:hypothetical protein